MEFIFWISASLILYTYLGYPVLLFAMATVKQVKRDLEYLFSRRDRRRRETAGTELPMVSLVVAAYNEEKVIEAKIQNMLDLDYPKDRIEIIIGSDGSSDKTNEIVSEYAKEGVTLYVYPRGGKSSVLNRTIPRANGEIVVLSDANTMFKRDAVRKLVRHFKSPQIGCVCGELRFISETGEQKAEGFYWKYEVILKFLESKLGSVLGANGAIYAIRKELFNPIPPNTIIDDFVIGMNVKRKGYRVIYDPEAVAYEEAADGVKSEFRRRVRIGAGDFQAIPMTIPLLNPLRGFIAFAYLSHKIIRWLCPFLMLSAFASSATLSINGGIYSVGFIGQVAFYLTALIGSKGPSILKVPYHFVMMNLALAIGFFKFIAGRQKVTWRKTERVHTALQIHEVH
jgi:cellulose synthase/poly-beta-1,6-N-acetylglucosamine synthase-like glycosyltransferase